MAGDVDGVKGSVCLAFEGFDVAEEVDSYCAPEALFQAGAGHFDEEGFDLYFVGGAGEDDSSFGLRWVFELLW